MRWKMAIGGLALILATVAGCKQRCFMTEYDLYTAAPSLALPHDLETDPQAAYNPDPSLLVGAPPTVSDPDRPIRFLSLSEAFAIALEHGNVGLQNPVAPGSANDALISFAGRSVTGSDYVRAFALDPAIVGADIEGSLAKFDARWISSLTWTTTDRPVGTPLDTFQAGTVLNAIRTQDANFSTQLVKPLPTGGVAGITFAVPYEFTNLPSRINPSYRPSLQFQFEQPLLQGFGVEINQIRASHPGSILTPNVPVGGRVEGILITRIRFDQARAEFERLVHQQMLNVEAAYWNLYGAYWTLYARELGLRLAFDIWRIEKAKTDAGRGTEGTLAQQRTQYEQFRVQRVQALQSVLEFERTLRSLLGLPADDGKRLVPSDPPTLAEYKPDWDSGLREALALRPELVLAREELKARQLDLIAQKNQLLPDLRLTSTYDINSIGNRIDGGSANNAFEQLGSNHFNNWAIGLQAQVPLGFRDANSLVRVAQLNLARTYYVLRDNEQKAQRFLAREFQQLDSNYKQIAVQRAIREAAYRDVRTRLTIIAAGSGVPDLNLLNAERNFSDALAAEYQAIVAYNTSLASYEYAKGTLLQYDNVVIGEGPLPACVQVRAADHARERAAALVLHERDNPVENAPVCEGAGAPVLPQLPKDKAPTLPALLQDAPVLSNPPPLPVYPTKNGPDGVSSRTPPMLPAKNSNSMDGMVPPPPGAQPNTSSAAPTDPLSRSYLPPVVGSNGTPANSSPRANRGNQENGTPAPLPILDINR